MRVWKIWAFAGTVDLTGMYGVGGDPPARAVLTWRTRQTTTDYPPLSLYEMAAVGRSYRIINPEFDDSTWLTVLVKAPGLLAELAAVVLLLTAGVALFGRPAATWTALALWLNPALIINGAGLGYLDAQMAMPALAGLGAAATGHPVMAGALIATAVLTKVQAVFVFPVVALAVFWRHRTASTQALGRFIVGGLAVTILVVLPFALRGALPNMMLAVSRLTTHDMLSANALNVWWIATWLIRSAYAAADLGWAEAAVEPVRILAMSRMTEVGLPNPRPVGTVLALVAIGWLLWRGRAARPLSGWAFLGGWCVFAYFLLAVQVHENHLYLAVPFLALAAGLEPRYRWLFWAVTVFATFNMYIFYGFGDGSPPLVDRGWTGVDLTVLASGLGILFSTDRAA